MSNRPRVSEHGEQSLTYGKYVGGFLGSVFLTLCAYWVAVHGTARPGVLEVSLAILAVVQFVMQMLLFLHVGEERGPRWKLAAAGFMLGIILILVGGSLWIMNNLNTRMTPAQMDQYLRSQDSL
ncbi:MAG TPA: cytochrome C oxidase subunit IV family protein [Candidatus Saccharimonadales bacterium]|jgi:cytochrome o ubiquinol oxidase operon protein cyoD